MPNIGKVLKDEITRLARKEAKSIAQPLSKQVIDLRKRVRDQRDQIADLKKALARKADKPVRITRDSGDEEEPIRIRSESVKSHRERLGLSQREMAMLLDVSSLTISNWETGKVSPSGENRLAFSELRKMGIRDVRQRLDQLEGE